MDSQAYKISAIIIAFLLTVFAFIPGSIGLSKRIRMTLYVLFGSVWVSLIAPLVFLFEVGFQKFVLLPVCNSYATPNSTYTSAELYLPSNDNYFWSTTSYQGAECISSMSRDPLVKLLGSKKEFGVSIIGALFTLLGSFSTWFALSYILLRSLWRNRSLAKTQIPTRGLSPPAL